MFTKKWHSSLKYDFSYILVQKTAYNSTVALMYETAYFIHSDVHISHG